jgi:hypothetical protein
MVRQVVVQMKGEKVGQPPTKRNKTTRGLSYNWIEFRNIFFPQHNTHTHTVQWPWESHTEPHTHTRRKRLYQEMRESKSFRSIVTLHFDSFDFSTRPKLDSFLILHETISLKLALVCACLRFLAALPDNWMDTLNRTNRAAAASEPGETSWVYGHTSYIAHRLELHRRRYRCFGRGLISIHISQQPLLDLLHLFFSSSSSFSTRAENMTSFH